MAKKKSFASLLAFYTYNPATNSARIIECLRGYSEGLTAEEVQARTGMRQSSVSGLLHRLRNEKVVESTGLFRKTSSGCYAEIQRMKPQTSIPTEERI